MNFHCLSGCLGLWPKVGPISGHLPVGVIQVEKRWGLSGNCQWTTCRNKLYSDWVVCPSEYKWSEETRDCGAIYCLPGSSHCDYAKAEHLCCPESGSCAWYDAKCNWNALGEYVTEKSIQVQEAWGNLTVAVQKKVTTAKRFATLTVQELLTIRADLLCALKSVKGMTITQYHAVKSKFVAAKLATYKVANFVMNLANRTVDAALDGLAAMSDIAKYTVVQVGNIVERLQEIDVWGKISSWTSATLEKLGALIDRIPARYMMQLADNVITNVTYAAKLTFHQLSGAGARLYKMSAAVLNNMLDRVNITRFAEAMKGIGRAVVNWTADQGRRFLVTLSKIWGSIYNWAASKISALGNMIACFGEEAISVIHKFSNAALCRATSVVKFTARQLSLLGGKMYNMTRNQLYSFLDLVNVTELAQSMKTLGPKVYNWHKVQANKFMTVLSRAWGVAKDWTAENIMALGNMIASIDVSFITDFADAQLAKAKNLVYCTAAQIRKLPGKLYQMSLTVPDHLRAVIKYIDSTALAKSVKNFALYVWAALYHLRPHYLGRHPGADKRRSFWVYVWALGRFLVAAHRFLSRVGPPFR